MRQSFLLLGISLLALSSRAEAHFNLLAPPAADKATDGGKGLPPCGEGAASGVVTPVQGGHALMLSIDEFVPHTGSYRFALSINARSELPLDDVVKDSQGKILPPDGNPKGTSAMAMLESPVAFPILADGMFTHTATGTDMKFMGSVMLPNVTCAKCTLQVDEFMQGHPYNADATGPGGGYFYHHCADLKITADPALPAFTPPGGSGGSGGSGSGGAAAGGSSGSGGSSTTAGSAGLGGTGGSSGTLGVGGQSGGSGGIGGSGGTYGSAGSAVSVNGGSATVATGGATPAGGTASAAAGATGQPTDGAAADSGGCGCSLAKRSDGSKVWAGLLLAFSLLVRRRRQR